MYTLAPLYTLLCKTWKLEPESERMDLLAADFAARVGAFGGRARVAVLPVTYDRSGRVVAFRDFMRAYGVEFSATIYGDGSHMFVFAYLAEPQPSPYVGAVVLPVPAVLEEAA